jgi:hypothetical protein
VATQRCPVCAWSASAQAKIERIAVRFISQKMTPHAAGVQRE